MYKKFLAQKGKNICFLNSASKNGWQPILAWDPDEIFQGKLQDLDAFLKRHKDKVIIGYFSYDLVYELENIEQKAKDDLKLPKIYLLAFSNYLEGKRQIPRQQFKSTTKFKPETSEKNYQKNYQKIQKHIRAGDIYQVNYTHRLKAKSKLNPREIFARISAKNPVDHLAYIEGDGFEILSASPERFIEISGQKISTYPIKGTRPRSKNTMKDLSLRGELKNSTKEQAELNMITDLLRNDLGKIAKAGTVQIEGQRLIKKCPTLWHTYSKISAEIDPKFTAIQALTTMLPGGSVTGCPKRRATQIIDQLEPTTRSIYCGAIGVIRPNQRHIDFSIAIRTIIKKGENLYLQVGGGVVIDSKEKAEYKESLDKAKSFMDIL